MLLFDMPAADVIGQAVIGLGHNRHGPGMVIQKKTGILIDHPTDRGVMHHADRMGIGDADRADKIAGFMNPVGAGHLAVAVERDIDRPRWGRACPACRAAKWR